MRDERTQRRGRAQAGYSLVEVLVVLAIIAGLVGTSTYMVGMIGAGALKSEALEITSAIKYSYSQAAMNNSQYRLVLDLDAGTYHTEVVESAFVRDEPTLDEDEEDELLTEEAQQLAAEKRLEEDLFDEDEDDPFNMNRRVTYKRVQNGVIDPGKLEDGVRIWRVIPGTGEPVETGKAAINFYPSGFQDPVIIILSDGEETFFSIQTEPLTGRVHLFSKELQPQDEFGQGESDE